MGLFGYLFITLVAAMLAPMAFLMGNKLLLGIAIIAFITGAIKAGLYNEMDNHDM